MRLGKYVIIILLIQSFTTSSLSSAETILEVEDLSDMFTHIEAIELEFTGDDQEGVYGYVVQGTESVEGRPCWKVETVFGEKGETQGYSIWVDKASGKTLKAVIDDQEFTGPLAEVYGNMTMGFFMGFVYSYWGAWSYQDFLEWDNSDLGTATPLGKQVQTYGDTSLETYGMRYEGYMVGDESVNYQYEVWYAPTQFGGVMTSLSVSATGDEIYNFELMLNSISLVEEQQIPDEFYDLIESESETETELESEAETGEGTGDEVEETIETNGGIPGYPLYSIVLSIGLLIILKRNATVSP